MFLEQTKATTSFAIGQVAIILVGIVSAKILAVHLGPEGIGVTSQLRNLYLFLPFLAGLGIANGLTVLVAENNARANQPALRNLIYTALLIVGGFAFFLALVAILAAKPLAGALLGDESLAFPFAIIALAMIFKALSLLLYGSLQGLLEVRRLVKANLVTAAAALLVLPLVLLWDIPGFALGLFLVALINVGFLVLALNSTVGHHLRPIVSRRAFSFGAGRRLLKFGGVLLGGQGVRLLEPVLVTSILLAMLGPVYAGLYAIVLGIPRKILTLLLQSNSTYTLPKVSGSGANLSSVVQIKNDALRVLLIFWLPAACLLMIFRHEVIIILYQPDFQPAAKFFALYLLGDLGIILSRPFRIGLLPSRRFGIHIGLMAGQSVLRIVLMVAFLARFGLLAAIGSYTLATWLIALLSFWYARRLFAFTFHRQTLLILIKSLIVFAAIALLINSSLPVLSYGLTSLLLAAWCLTIFTRQELMSFYALGHSKLSSGKKYLKPLRNKLIG